MIDDEELKKRLDKIITYAVSISNGDVKGACSLVFITAMSGFIAAKVPLEEIIKRVKHLYEIFEIESSENGED